MGPSTKEGFTVTTSSGARPPPRTRERISSIFAPSHSPPFTARAPSAGGMSIAATSSRSTGVFAANSHAASSLAVLLRW